MTHERQIYLLDPRQLPPETIAVTFAKTSRSPESFRQIAAELTDQKSSEFNEKWVVGYGHSSVAEHAILHIAAENVSRLAVECIESNRLASYTEKSTRYQTWQPDAFFLPDEFKDSTLRERYLKFNQALFNGYAQFIPRVVRFAAESTARLAEESDSAFERRLRSKAIDVCRYLLPASSLANVGITINARSLEHAISKMLSHSLSEVRAIGSEIKTAASASIPTLLKYAEPLPYLDAMEAQFSPISPLILGEAVPWFKLLHYDTDAVDHLLAGVYYRYNPDPHTSYESSLLTVQQMSPAQKEVLLRPLLNDRERHTIPLRELEHITFQFEATLDQGAYYEIKRHRMLTLTPRPLTTHLGYAVPRLISDAGLGNEYAELMNQAEQVYSDLEETSPEAASYVVPNGFNRRFLITLNLRSAMHFIALRSELNAHFGVRRLALKLADEIESVIPGICSLLPRCLEESVESIEDQYFSKLE
jgi:thymidylate synthase ThyX